MRNNPLVMYDSLSKNNLSTMTIRARFLNQSLMSYMTKNKVIHVVIERQISTIVGSSSQSNFSCPPFHSNTQECSNVIQSFRHLASICKSKNKLASIDYDKIAYDKVQYLPPSYNGDGFFELPPNRLCFYF
jgi:hypothetical protein